MSAIPIVYVGGFRDGFPYWNALPVILSFVVVAVSGGVAAISFATVCAGFSALVHLAWIFDWGGTSSSSSTSALIFIFLPFWSVLFGAIAGVIGWLIARFAAIPHQRNL